MSKIFDVKGYSFNVKVALLLSLLALFLITILFALIVPKIQNDKYNSTIKEIEKVLFITEEQIKLAGKALMMQSKLEMKANQYLLELELTNIKNKIKNDISIKEIKKELESSTVTNFSNYAIKYKNEIFINRDMDIYKKYKLKNYNNWEKLYSEKISKKEYVYNISYNFFTTQIFKDLEITLFYKNGALNKNHFIFEEELKKNLQNTFNLTQDLHKGKTYLFWLNSKYKNEDTEPLSFKSKKERQNKYTLSKMSNASEIYTGNLSAKEVINASNKSFIEHTLNGREAISWVRDLYKKEYDGYIFLLVKTVYKDDLIKRLDSGLSSVLPSAIISLSLALLIGFFILKRFFKSVSILTNVAREVNKGNKKIRSRVLGNDDIGTLGIAFDSMLDSFEYNIKNLDLKVEEKTKKLQLSLEEKDVLLKEIHHRVKNNLALTISLIKLQQEEVVEEKTHETLIDIQERIYTMELLHRKLYESPNINQINFQEYILSLIDSISSAYDFKKNVNIETQIDEIYLNIEKAMSSGLVLNEVVTNAFKYAFLANKNPHLFLSMKQKSKMFILTIRDNGKGIPKDIDILNSSTLGLKLINSIVKLQLRGTVDYLYNEGAEFTIIFQE